jgi:hypothetical protein
MCCLCTYGTINRDISRSPNVFVSGSGSRPRSQPPVGRRKTTLSSSLWKAATIPSPNPRRLRGTTGNTAARRRHERRRRAKVGARVEIWRARSSGICTRTPREERVASKRPDRRPRRKSLLRYRPRFHFQPPAHTTAAIPPFITITVEATTAVTLPPTIAPIPFQYHRTRPSTVAAGPIGESTPLAATGWRVVRVASAIRPKETRGAWHQWRRRD